VTIRARIFFVLSLLLVGCAAPVAVEQLDSQAAYGRLNRSALAENQPSETTLTALRRYGLLESFKPWHGRDDRRVARPRG
jgi:hypothetical protein